MHCLDRGDAAQARVRNLATHLLLRGFCDVRHNKRTAQRHGDGHTVRHRHPLDTYIGTGHANWSLQILPWDARIAQETPLANSRSWLSADTGVVPTVCHTPLWQPSTGFTQNVRTIDEQRQEANSTGQHLHSPLRHHRRACTGFTMWGSDLDSGACRDPNHTPHTPRCPGCRQQVANCSGEHTWCISKWLAHLA